MNGCSRATLTSQAHLRTESATRERAYGRVLTSEAVGLRSEDEVDELAKCCVDFVVAGFIEPTTWHWRCRGEHGPLLRQAEKGWKRPVRGFWITRKGHGAG